MFGIQSPSFDFFTASALEDQVIVPRNHLETTSGLQALRLFKIHLFNVHSQFSRRADASMSLNRNSTRPFTCAGLPELTSINRRLLLRWKDPSSTDSSGFALHPKDWRCTALSVR